MKKEKVMFVSCVNNQSIYQECVKYIDNLLIPKNIEIEVFPMYEVKSMASAYNQVLDKEAAFKVYLHQDTYILNQNFIADVYSLFKENKQLGLIGMAGCKKLNSDGHWGKGQGMVGKWYGLWNEKVFPFKLSEVTAAFEPVEAVDGFLMATQYDIKWRDDLFKGFHLYDISQCREFSRHGFEIGIPRQVEPWCFHIGNPKGGYNTPEYLHDQSIYVQHYS